MNYNPPRLGKHKALWISVHLSSDGNVLGLFQTLGFHTPPRKRTYTFNEREHHLESTVFYFIKQIVWSLDADRLIRHSSHAKTHIIIAVMKQNG